MTSHKEKAERTTEFVFEDIGNGTHAIFVVCSDGSRSLALLEDLKRYERETTERVCGEMIKAAEETAKENRCDNPEKEGHGTCVICAMDDAVDDVVDALRHRAEELMNKGV